MSRSLRTILLVVLVLAVAGILLYRSREAIGLEGFDWSRLGDALHHARLGPLAVALVAIFASYALRAARWVRFCRHVGGASFSGVYATTLMGFTAIFLFGRAGEPVRPLLIARKERLPVSSMFGIYVLERVFDIGSTVALAGVALLVFPRLMMPGSEGGAFLAAARTTGTLLLAGFTAAVVVLVYFRLHGARWLEQRFSSWRQAHGWRARVAGLSSGFNDGLQAIRTGNDMLAAVGYSAVHWFVVLLIYDWVAASFGGRLAELGLSAAVLVLVFTMVGSTVQLPGVGGGSQLGSFLAFTVIFGVEKEPAAAAAIVLWLITFAACSLAGVPLLIREGWSMGELRRLARAEAEAEAAGGHVVVPDVGAKTGDLRR